MDPAYLIKQNGEWRVFPDVSDWNIAEQFAKDKVDTLKRLKTWYKERKAESKKKTRRLIPIPRAYFEITEGRD